MKPTNLNKAIFLLVFGAIQSMLAQVGLPDVMPKTPQASTLHHYGSQNVMTVTHPNPIYRMSQQQRNEAIMREVEMRQRQENEYRKRVQGLIDEAVSEFSSPYSLPSHNHKKGTIYYQKAFDKLQSMDISSYSLKEAVFAVENAFYEEQQNYEEFEKVITQTGDFLREKIIEFGYNPNSNVAKNLILFQFFSDTLKIKNKKIEHLPLKYDFDDYMGKKDWSKMFVHKLLETGSGQCHSLPLLYLILAEEIGAIAHLATAPNHTYIKFPDDQNRNWYNVELTSNILTTNAHILQSGYIKVEAIQNGLYMRPLDKQQLFAQMLVDLSMGYERKYGNDEFTKRVTQEALKLHSANIVAHLNKANYYNEIVFQVLEQLGITKETINVELPKYPKALELIKTMIKSYKAIEALGYKNMPDEEYQKWLENMKKEKDKQEQKRIQQQLKKQNKQIIKL